MWNTAPAHTISWDYAAAGRTTAANDNAGPSSAYAIDTWDYTVAGRTTGETSTAMHSYTPNGKEASVYDALGATHLTQYAYHTFHRLSSTTFADTTTRI